MYKVFDATVCGNSDDEKLIAPSFDTPMECADHCAEAPRSMFMFMFKATREGECLTYCKPPLSPSSSEEVNVYRTLPCDMECHSFNPEADLQQADQWIRDSRDYTSTMVQMDTAGDDEGRKKGYRFTVMENVDVIMMGIEITPDQNDELVVSSGIRESGVELVATGENTRTAEEARTNTFK